MHFTGNFFELHEQIRLLVGRSCSAVQMRFRDATAVWSDLEQSQLPNTTLRKALQYRYLFVGGRQSFNKVSKMLLDVLRGTHVLKERNESIHWEPVTNQPPHFTQESRVLLRILFCIPERFVRFFELRKK